MLPLAAALLGGATVAAGSYTYKKVKTSNSTGKSAKKALFSEFRGLVGDLRNAASEAYTETRQSSWITVVVTRSAEKAGQGYREIQREVTVLAAVVYEEAQAGLHYINENEIAPLKKAAGEEWRALREAVQEDDSLVADAAREVFGLASRVGGGRGRSSSPGARRPASMSPKAVWRSLQQAKEMVFDDSRARQLEDIEGDQEQPGEGSARSQIIVAERTVNRYLKVAASSAVVATAGALFYPPLQFLSGAMILFATYPVFKGAYHDTVMERRLSVKLLDSISFLGLLAGGYFVMCSVTATIFHASTKMMLKTEDRSRQMLANMFGQQPRSVLVLMEGIEIEVPFESLSVGDTLVVHAGQMIPVDGSISAGTAAVDQRVLTGEAQPAEKGLHDRVFAATIVLAGRIEVLVEKTGTETAAAQIRDMLANTTDFRTAIQARWRHVADQTVLPTLGIAGVALAVLNPGSALAVLNSNYVAVMKVASPLGMLNFLQRASQAGVLIKDGRALEGACKIDTLVFDKTGTLTETQPHVGQIHCLPGAAEDELLAFAASVEANQSHPIAHAILQEAASRKLALSPLDDARYEIGYGIEARIGGQLVRVGSARYMSMQRIAMPEEFISPLAKVQAGGASVVYVAVEDRLAGAIELLPTLRPEAREVVETLKGLGLTLYIISGDQTAPTEALASELGIDHYFAEVLPQDKSAMVEKLQREGKHVCFVGDGINDAIALKKADVSVSLRGASSLATNTAQIILMDESLRQLPKIFEIAREYNANLKTLMTTTFAPGLASLAGVFLLGTGTTTALTLFSCSMVAGMVNAIWPALRNQEDTLPLAPGAPSESPESSAEEKIIYSN